MKKYLQKHHVIVLIKLCANPLKEWTQPELAHDLCMSVSTINKAIKRFRERNLISLRDYSIVRKRCKEFLSVTVGYAFAGKRGDEWLTMMKESLEKYPDPVFEELLSLVDKLRIGDKYDEKIRERIEEIVDGR